MRKLILSALLLASVFQTAKGEQSGDWTYLVENNQATIMGYTGAGGAVTIPSEVNGIPVVQLSSMNTAIFGGFNTSVTSVIIPNSVTSIGTLAFYGCSGLTSVTIPNSVTSIEERAFGGCSSLTSITIPNSVTSISCFSGCTGLTSIIIPNSVTSVGYEAFGGCTSLTSIIIPNSVTSIGDNAFASCTGLTSVTIPNSVTSIGNGAFSGCTGLTSILIPYGTAIGAGALDLNTGLTKWTYSVSNNGATITDYTGAGGAVTIPSEVNGIPVVIIGNGWSNPFAPIWKGYIDDSVTSITIPNSVTTFAYRAFALCTRLASITIPNSVTYIAPQAFDGCSSLTSITIPNSMTSIGSEAFYGCSGLTSVTIPNSVTSIDNNAFRSCTSLASITIPNSVTSIGVGAFIDCSSLTSITIPNSVTSIGGGAFGGCTLTTITMPDRFIAQVAQLGISGQVATDYLVNALANNDAFVTAVANKIKATGGNYGLATQSGLSSAIEPLATKTELAPLATKTELTSALTESRTAGVNSVLSNPNLWTLYTTSQIQNMAVGDLVLTKNVGGTFTLNYDIEQSADLQTWTTYAPLSLPLTGLPIDKAFVRIKAKQ